MRRKPGTILPIESELLEAAAALIARGVEQFHGFLIAHEMRGRQGGKDLIAYGNLYRILDRMQRAGLLESAWEDPETATQEKRPRRRLYRLTALGVHQASRAQADFQPLPRLAAT